MSADIRRNNFDLLRLLAAMQVVTIHLADHLHLPLWTGCVWLLDQFPGVAMFFVISGFLVTRSWIDCDRHVGRYALRRGLRIYPGLWVNFIVVLGMLKIGGAFALPDLLHPAFWRFQFWQFLIGSDFYGGYFAGGIYDWSHFYKEYPSGVLWTINVELGFYVLVPVVFWSLRWANVAILYAAVGTLFFARLNAAWINSAPGANTTALLNNGPLPYFWIFLLGAAAQVNWPKIRHLFEGRFPEWLALYLLVGNMMRHGFDISVVDFTGFAPSALIEIPLLAGCVLSAAHTWPKLSSVLRGQDLSYGLYLYHMPLIATLAGFGIGGQRYLWPVAFAAAFALAAMSWFLVERPWLRLKNIFGSSRTVGTVARAEW